MARQTAVSVGQNYDVEAIRLNDDGEGVVSIHGFTVFVPGLLPGERGQVKISSAGKSYGRADIIQRFNDAAERIDAPCEVFDRCGGCQLQHLPYELQLDHKRQTVNNALKRVGGFTDIAILPTLGMKDPWRYRNNVQVPCRFDGNGGYDIGFYAPSSHTLVPTDVCLLEPRIMEQTAAAVAQLLAVHLGAQAQYVHHLILRQSFTTNDIMVTLSTTRPLDWDTVSVDEKTSVLRLLVQVPHVVSVAATVQTRLDAKSVWGPDVTILAGVDYLTERLGEVEYLISPRSFFQVNPLQSLKLYEQVERRITTDRPRLLDAYCGTGSIALWLAAKAKSVTGIESVPSAIDDAKRNALHNRIHHAQFLLGRVESQLQQLVASGKQYDVVILDPPRKGCDRRVLDSLIEMKPPQIVYVSCNPSTLARDLRVLSDAGYTVGAIQPVDMFPQTAHVECVVSLTLYTK